MGSQEQPDRRVAVLLVNLALIGVCILALLAGVVLYQLVRPSKPAAPQVATPSLRPSLLPSATPTVTPTPTRTRPSAASLTPTLTLTLTSTATAAPTVTQTPFPQLTAARPVVRSDAYRLKSWSPQDADLMGRTLQGYPESLAAAGANRNEAYYSAYRFAVDAWREALLRFPDATEAQSWRWNLGLDLMRQGSTEAGQAYATLIATALNNSTTQIPYLYEWFASNEPRLSLLMTAVEPPDGYLSSYVVELKGETGSAFIWLLEGATAFAAFPLETNFNSLELPESNWIVADMNGEPKDGQEAAIYRTDSSSPFAVNPPRIFSLDETPAKLLPFLPGSDIFRMGGEFTNYWALKSEAQGDVLQFHGVVFDVCPVEVTLNYRWNGEYFAKLGEGFSLQPAEKTLAFCQSSIDYAITAWGPRAALTLMEPITEKWPPAADVQGKPYPNDAHDEWLFRMAVYHALLGERDQAVELFNRLSTQPQVPTSRWIQPAQAFLGAYQSKEDIYRACLDAPLCDPGEAIKYLVSLSTPGENVWETLKRLGVNPNASGYFDFDGDEQQERWFTTRYRERQAPEFWILVQTERGYTAVNVGTVENIPPEIEYLEEAYIADDGLTMLPAVFLEKKLAFNMQRLPDNQEPYLVPVPLRKEYPNKFFIPLQAAKNALLSGGDPKEIQKKLANLEDYPGLLCKGAWTCDEYYYYLGLASELAGDAQTAVKAYHRLWLDYSKSPYTAMARFKLSGEGLSTLPTAIPGTTAPAAPTLTPNFTPFATATPATPAIPTATPGPGTIIPTATPRPGGGTVSPSAPTTTTGPAATTPGEEYPYPVETTPYP